MLGTGHPLADRQQCGELVAGPGRIPRLPGPGGEVGAGPQGARVCANSTSGYAHRTPRAQAAFTDENGSMWKIVSYVGNSGNFAAARDLQQRVLDASVRTHGPEHPHTLTARANLAR